MKIGIKIRNTIYWILYIIDKIFHRKVKILVLCYHSFDASEKWRFSIDLNTFRKQLLYLKDNFTFITAQDLQDFLNNKTTLPKHSVLITIDDGYHDNLRIVDILNEYNIKPVLFVLSEPNNANRVEIDNQLPFLSKDDLSKLKHEFNWEIGSHTNSHVNLTEVSIDDATQEIMQSKRNVIEKFGQCEYFSYPKGRYNQDLIEIVKKSGYKLAFTMDDALISQKTNKLRIPRVGIDASHSIDDFKHSITISVILFRQLVKYLLPVNYIERIIR